MKHGSPETSCCVSHCSSYDGGSTKGGERMPDAWNVNGSKTECAILLSVSAQCGQVAV